MLAVVGVGPELLACPDRGHRLPRSFAESSDQSSHLDSNGANWAAQENRGITLHDVASDGQPRLLTGCAAESLANLELATDNGALGVNGAATAKTYFAL